MYFTLFAFFSILTVSISVKAVPYRGYPNPFIPAEIGGGSEAPLGSASWHVSLQWGMGGYEQLKHFCSGAILNSYWVVTSGHCILRLPSYGYFVVKAGLHDLRNPEPTMQMCEVADTFVHPQYMGDAGPFDIALVKLSKPLNTLDQKGMVKSVALPKSNGPSSTGNVLLSSWGSTWRILFPNTFPKLQLLTLNAISIANCNQLVNSIIPSSTLSNTANVCTDHVEDTLTACNTDPGSPLIKMNGDIAMLEGIVSWGIIPCNTKNAPIIYTRVSSYASWIRDTVAKN